MELGPVGSATFLIAIRRLFVILLITDESRSLRIAKFVENGFRKSNFVDRMPEEAQNLLLVGNITEFVNS